MAVEIKRSYVEWDISGILDGSSITKTEFRYNGKGHNGNATGVDIRGLANQPTARTAAQIYSDIAAGAVYLDENAVFPELGETKNVGTTIAWDTDPKADLESALGMDWFALGFKTQETEVPGTGVEWSHSIYSTEKDPAAVPKPTLYVEYELPAGLENKSANMASKMVAAGLI